MNIKKILVLLLFLIAVVGIIAPVNATLKVDYLLQLKKSQLMVKMR